jgi:hypothetical protein
VQNSPIKPSKDMDIKVFKNIGKAPSSKIIEITIGNIKEKLNNRTNMLNRFIIDLGFINFF